MDFAKFNSMVDLDALKADVQKASDGNFEKKEVPCGTYEVKIEKLELVESKAGKPMLSVWFRILTGDFEKQMIFMNQVITQGFQIHICNEFLRSLDTGVDVHFDDFVQYNDIIMDVAEKINIQGLEYALEYGESKGYNTFKITEVFETNN